MKITPGAKIFRPFSEAEAWTLFKWAAYGEAVGWTLLITGIIAAKTRIAGHTIALPFLGQTHGMLFAFYLAIVITTATSMRWSMRRSIVAIAVSVPPYGTLVFEQWVARDRRRQMKRNYKSATVRIVMYSGEHLLLVQPSDGVKWSVPSDILRADETPHQAAARLMSQLGGFEATALHLVYARTAQSPSGLWRLYYFSAHFKPGEAPTARSIRKSFEFLDEARYVDTVFRGDLEQELARDARDLGLVVTA